MSDEQVASANTLGNDWMAFYDDPPPGHIHPNLADYQAFVHDMAQAISSSSIASTWWTAPVKIKVRYNDLDGGRGRYEAWIPGSSLFIGIGMSATSAVHDLVKQANAFVQKAHKQSDRVPVLRALKDIQWEFVSVKIETGAEMMKVLDEVFVETFKPRKRDRYSAEKPQGNRSGRAKRSVTL